MDSLYKEDILRFSTAGSVDDGKSTFIGRLLYDTGNILSDHLASLEIKSKDIDPKSKNLAFAILTDGLQAEQEQGITIDIAYRYFSTQKRRFILADSPGHERYTRNMATAASNADATVILLDSEKGISLQTRRHACIASLLGVPRVVVAVNKMDLVDNSRSRFIQLEKEFLTFAERLQFKSITIIPISALHGDNVVYQSQKMDWYRGPTVLDSLEGIQHKGDRNTIDTRFPVQVVLRGKGTIRYFGGMLTSGRLALGDDVVILPSGERTKIGALETVNADFSIKSLSEIKPGDIANIRLTDERDVSRGDMIVRANNRPQSLSEFEAMLIWFDEKDLGLNKEYLVKHTTKDTKGVVRKVHYSLDVTTLHKNPTSELKLNEIGRCALQLARPIQADSYDKNRGTGSFILIDPETNRTVAAGLIINRVSEADRRASQIEESGHVATNITESHGAVTRTDREALTGSKAKTFWFTGLSGSGKSTLSVAFEKQLISEGKIALRLDGDNLRHGLNRDLGFSDEDRGENIRRTAEAAKLLNEAGVTAICSLICPFEKDRQHAREIIGSENFIEVYISTPIEVCEQRDSKGLYARARKGEIVGFTGVSAPYEAPKVSDVSIDMSILSLSEAIGLLKALR